MPYKSLYAIILTLIISSSVYTQTLFDTLQVPRAPFQKLRFKEDPRTLEVQLFRSVNSYRTHIRDFIIPIVDKSMLPGSFVIPASIFLYGRASEKAYEEQTGFLMTTSLVLNAALTFAAKTIINRTRPYVALSNVYYESEVGFDVYSFPSGHTSTVTTIATMMALRYPKHPQYYLPFLAWGVTVAYGRMYMGMHYPIDLLGGAALGVMSALVTYGLRAEILNFKNLLLNENKPDDNQKNIDLAIVAFSLLTQGIINEFITPNVKKGKINLSPSVNNNGVLMNMAYQF